MACDGKFWLTKAAKAARTQVIFLHAGCEMAACANGIIVGRASRDHRRKLYALVQCRGGHT